jgi:hypothetical protein
MNDIETGIYQLGCVGNIVINEGNDSASKDFDVL